jgi:hypothetical protein
MSEQDKNLVTFGTAIRAPEDIRTITLDSVIRDIKDGRWATEIGKIRKTGNPELAKAIKTGLPYFIYGIFQGKRSNERLVQMNGAVLDYDHISDIEGFKTLVSQRLSYVKYAFQSPRDGVKLVIPFDAPVTDEEAYRCVFEHLKSVTDASLNRKDHETHEIGETHKKDDEADQLPSQKTHDPLRSFAALLLGVEKEYQADNTPDPARACFVSYDPELWENKECVPYCVKESFLPAQTPGVKPVPRQNGLRNSENASGAKSIIPRGDDAIQNSVGIKDSFSGVVNEEPDETIKNAIAYLAQQKLDYHDWIKIGMALYHQYGENGKPLWDMFADNPHYRDTQRQLDRRWKSFRTATGISAGSIIHIAQQYGWEQHVVPAQAGIHAVLKENISIPIHHPNCEGRCPSTPLEKVVPIDKLRMTSGSGTMEDEKNISDSAASRLGVEKENLLRSSGTANVGTGAPPVPHRQQTKASAATNGHAGTCVPTDYKKHRLNRELVELFGKPANVELDVQNLPPVLKDYLALTDSITDAQSGAKLTAFLPCIAGNIGNRVYMVNNSARVFPHIWSIIIGPSSISRKTTVIKLARQTLEPYEEAINDEEPAEYLKKTLVMTDVTMTKLLSMLSENPNRVFIQMEVSAWMRQMNRHWNAGMKQALTDLFDGVDKTIANMDRTERIRKPAFSIIAASTEGWFYQEMRDVADQQSGFLQRFLFCLVQNVSPEEIDLTYREGEETSPELRRYEEMFSAFRSISGHHKLGMDETAKTLRNSLYKKKFESIASQKNDVLMSYFTRIYDGYFFKFCIIFTLLKQWRELLPEHEKHERNERHEAEAVLPSGKSDNVGTGAPPVPQSRQTGASAATKGHAGTCVPTVETSSSPIASLRQRMESKNREKQFFETVRVDEETVRQSFSLCDYYFENTKPFLASLSENMKLDNERRLIALLCRFPQGIATHSQLMVKARMKKYEFKDAIDCLIEKEAVSVRTAATGPNGIQARTYFLHPEIYASWTKNE